MQNVQFLIITGLSGSGKSLVHSCLEDTGFFCVDNLPLGLLNKFFELTTGTGGEIHRVAMVLDIRDRSFPTDFCRDWADLRERYQVKLVFLEASAEMLLRRFSETRRPHPLAGSRPLEEALKLERELLEPVRKLADVVIDTSRFNVHELRDYVRDRFAPDASADVLVVQVRSFGFKHGTPPSADLLFDVRFLPNPFFVPELKFKTGLDQEVIDFVLTAEGTKEFLDRLKDFVHYLLPHYIREGKSYLTIALGCTGGKHRSVVVSSELAESLKSRQRHVTVSHRDRTGRDRCASVTRNTKDRRRLVTSR